MASFYGLYTLVRDLRGDQPVSVYQAFLNARRTIRWERWVGMFHERDLQQAVISQRWLIQLCDDYYGSFHFLVTVGVLLLMFFRFPTTYRKWRNVLALTTGLALIGFYFFPLMPPRLLPHGYGFVDTLQSIGGLWNFSNGPVNDVSNQYAAMPSLHTAWSLWCSLALSRVIRPLWARIAVFAYPVFTVFAIVVTGNHFFADAVAGVGLVLVSISVAVPVTQALDRRARRVEAAHRRPPTPDSASVAQGSAPTGVK